MTELPPVDPLDQQLEQQVFEAGKVFRTGQLEVRQKMDDLAERERVRTGNNEVALAGETERLKDRMVWLHKHPRLSRFIGGSAVHVSYKDSRSYSGYRIPEQLSTVPLDDGEVMNIREGHLLVSGLVFRRFYKDINRTLYVEREIRDETTGIHARRRLYDLYAHDTETGPRLQVHGRAFTRYREKQQQRIMSDYIQENEWAQKYAGRYSDYPGFSYGYRPIRFAFDGLGYEDGKQTRLLNEVLAPRMEPGGDWEYPDEMFLEPLTLVRQMNILLGTKNK